MGNVYLCVGACGHKEIYPQHLWWEVNRKCMKDQSSMFSGDIEVNQLTD